VRPCVMVDVQLISVTKGTYCLKCSVVMEAACSSDTSILVYQIPPFQTPEQTSPQATI